MKNNLKYLISSIIIILLIIGVIIFFINKSNASSIDIKSKINDELNYLETTILTMINNLNNLNIEETASITKIEKNISAQSSNSSSDSSDSNNDGQSSSESSKKDDSSDSSESVKEYSLEQNSVLTSLKKPINWAHMEVLAEDLYSYWSIVTIDLNTTGIDGQNILAFNSNLDNLLTAISEKNKQNSAICLANLYSLLPKYATQLNSEDEELQKSKIQLLNIKSNILFAYSIVDTNKWTEVNSFISEAETQMNEYINNSSVYSKQKQNKINKSYVFLKELIKSSNDNDLNVFYIKYINLIKELNNIS